MAKKKNNKLVTGVVVTLVAAGVVGGTAALTKGFTEKPKLNVVDKILSKEKIYSVQFESGEAEGKRLDAAVGLEAGINGQKNDFDNIYPYSEMKRVKDVYGNEFIDIPLFYEKIDILPDHSVKYSITGVETKGFNPAPMFIQGDDIVEHVQIGAYEASFANNNRDLASVSHATAAVNITMDAARTLAKHHGNYLFDWRQNQALQTLFVVEFATLDSQDIMRGIVEYIPTTGVSQDERNHRTFSVTQGDASLMAETKITTLLDAKPSVNVLYGSSNKVVGSYVLESYKYDKDTNKVISVTLDENIDEELEKISGFDVAQLHFNINGVAKTGLTDNKKGSSNGDPKKATAMNYRGIENWYGSAWTWIDGLAAVQEDGVNKICMSMETAKNNDRDSYKKYNQSDIIGKVTEEGLYIANTQSVTQDYCYFTFSTAFHIGYVGGGYSNGDRAGAFCLNVGNGVSGAHCSHGFRLSYIPQ